MEDIPYQVRQCQKCGSIMTLSEVTKSATISNTFTEYTYVCPECTNIEIREVSVCKG